MGLLSTEKVTPIDALKTYRYLRLGMLGAVVLLALSIEIEAVEADCLQNSVSAYYYTPVRTAFVGALFGIGLALIVYKGRGSAEDFFLNLAGMLAPVVAVIPMTNMNRSCLPVSPDPLLFNQGQLPNWHVANIENNFRALLLTGAASLTAALILWLMDKKRGRKGGALPFIGAIFIALLGEWWLLENWDSFHTGAHFAAAIAMFVFLAGAIWANVFHEKQDRSRLGLAPRPKWLTRAYVAIGLLMVVGVAIPAFGISGKYHVLVLEAYEILWFSVYWVLQTIENWQVGEGAAAKD